jgi:hypothetical protein
MELNKKTVYRNTNTRKRAWIISIDEERGTVLVQYQVIGRQHPYSIERFMSMFEPVE